MKRCMYCGQENEDSAVNCTVCGNRLADIPDGQEDRPSAGLDVYEETVKKEEDTVTVTETKTVTEETVSAAETAEEAAEAAAPETAEAAATEIAEAAAPESAEAAAPKSAETAASKSAETAASAQNAAQASAAQTGAAPYDNTPGYGQDWRQDVGRGQTYAARQQYEARTGNEPQRTPREQYGDAGYGYRQVQGQSAQGRERADYGRHESAGGSKAFMIRARKRVKSFSFFMMALFFTAMLAANAWNIISGNSFYNLSQADTMLENILGGTNTFATQAVSEAAKQLVSMVVNVAGIIDQLGTSVRLGMLLVILIPNALYALGLWLMFGQTSTRRRQFSMGGYTLARVMLVLKFIIACLVLAIGLVISVYFVVVGASSARFTSSFIEGLLMLVVMIVLAILTVLYYVQWMFCFKVVKFNSRTGADPGRMPGFVAVMSLLLAAAAAALMIPMAPNDYIGLASRGCAVGYFFFFAIWVIVYKIKVKRN